MGNPVSVHVQVCYAKPDFVFLRELTVPVGATLRDAIQQSELLETVPEVDLMLCRVGIHGKLKTLETVLRDHDRVEIYRALIADPKDARRRRAETKDDRKIR